MVLTHRTKFMASSFAQRFPADVMRQDEIDVFFENIYAGFYDTALRLLECDPELAVTRYVNDETALHALARKPSAYACRSVGLLKRLANLFLGLKFTEHADQMSNKAHELLERVWQEIMRRQDANVADFISKPSNLLFDAAKVGNFELLAVLLSSSPGLVGELDENRRSLFHVAVLNHQLKILHLIPEIDFNEELLAVVDNEKNSILHLAAKYTYRPPYSSMCYTDMQQQLLNFKDIEIILPPSLREMKNAEGMTPRELFHTEHKSLLEKEQRSMSSTAETIIFCGTIFAVTTLRALFIVPGGNIDERIPLHVKETLLRIYTMSSATSFFSSCLSVMMFLLIFTSSYKETEFLVSLPLKFVVGLSAFYTSLVSIMVAFIPINYLCLYGISTWIPRLTLVLGCGLLTSSVLLLYPWLRDMFYAVYRGWYLSKRCNH